MNKVVGIWMDKRNAKLVLLEETNEEFRIVTSAIEEFNPKGGSGTPLKGGPQDVVQDGKYANREKQQEKFFFNEIIKFIKDFDAIVIFGPAEMGKKFAKELAHSFPAIASKVKEVLPADSMTDNEIKAWVKAYFKFSVED